MNPAFSISGSHGCLIKKTASPWRTTEIIRTTFCNKAIRVFSGKKKGSLQPGIQ
jgi:hypothetical protein